MDPPPVYRGGHVVVTIGPPARCPPGAGWNSAVRVGTLSRVTDHLFVLALPALLALPWLLTPLVLRARIRASANLLDEPDAPPTPAPRVSVILPARNEATNIGPCLRSLRDSTWPDLDIVVVDDHSTDGTGALAREAAGNDPRVRIVEAPDLPNGWFGKQWACAVGAKAATGELLLFTDADTRHAPALVTRMVRLRARRGAELLSVAGRQDTGTVWEAAVQPSVFLLLVMRYGATRQLERARRPESVVANGQCFMLSRAAYDALGGHATVRAFVAEDLMMAQAVHRQGGRISLGFGVTQLRTRMYEGLGPLVRGWRKNVFAGGRHAIGDGLARALYPLLLLSFPLAVLVPMAVLLWQAAVGGDLTTSSSAVWAMLATAGVLGAFVVANRANGDTGWRALLAPLGAAVLLVICLQAIARGDAVEWKGRAYRSA